MSCFTMPKASFFLLLALMMLVSAGAVIAQPVPFGQVASSISNPEPFGLWLQEFKRDAMGQGISAKLLSDTFDRYRPDERIVALDRKQPEAKGQKTFTQYLSSVVSAQRVADGLRYSAQSRADLETVAAQYGVPPQYIVALWGIETSYGRITGNYIVPQALATLAYEGRRADFFRGELLKSLLILQQGNVGLADMKGSWAGAMGQSQFMPSSYLAYAVDQDGDGRKDIWNSEPDVFGSIANYLAKSGWNPAHGWGVAVRLPPAFDPSLADGKTFQTAAAWSRLGLLRADGTMLGNLPPAALKIPGKPNEGSFLIFDNYKILMKWNRSDYFATSVGLLADKVSQ